MNKCSLCGDPVVHGITTCGRCRGAQPFTTKEVAAAFGVPIESLCAHQFEIAVVALDPAPDIYRCTKCGAERKHHKQPLVVSPEQHMANAKEDARMFGVGFVVDGKRVSPQSVVVVREPVASRTPKVMTINDLARQHGSARNSGGEGHGHDYFQFTVRELHAFVAAVLDASNPSFDDFWLREGPSLAWDEDRKRAARRIWDAARK